MAKYGVIDLGTNTFHLLIVSAENGQLKELVRERVFVKLAESGIQQIGLEPYQRGLDCIQRYHQILTANEVNQVRAIGTAALRTASNGPQFIAELFAHTGIQVEVISGDREAELIYQGVRLAVPFGQEYGLIMDIGGGSVEFIIANQQGIHWAQSFPVGVAVLFQQFHQLDPISQKEQEILEQHLEQTLQPLLKVLPRYSIQSLIGASGTFDVIETFLAEKSPGSHFSKVDVQNFHPLKNTFLPTTLAERLLMNQLPQSRAEMIIVAFLLIEFILHHSQAKDIIISSYAMKEGMLSEMIKHRSI